MRRTLVALLVAVSLPGCGTMTVGRDWTEAPGATWVERRGHYSIDVPTGWVFRYWRSEDKGNPMVATRDGPLLQRIVVTHRQNNEAFPVTEQQASSDTLPQELAERFIAETASVFEQDVVDVLANEPAMLDGVDGFRVRLQVRVGDLRYHIIAYGVSTAAGFFVLSYAAPLLHYFDRDRNTFERTVTTFRLLGKSAAVKTPR